MKEPIKDDELIRLIAQKDAQALEQLYDRYERPMYAFAIRIVGDAMAAEEIVQELFVRVWNTAPRIRTDTGAGRVSTWMFAVARNLAIDSLRRTGRRPAESLAEEEWELTAGPASTEDAVEQRLLGEEMKEALSELSGDQQQVLEMIYYMGYTQQEVAERAQIPLGTVKSRVRLALQALRKRFELAGKEGVRG